MRELTALGVKRANKPGRYRAGANLYLQVTPTKDGDGVVKSWILALRDRRPRTSHGPRPATKFTLREARNRARKHLQGLVDGIDPLAAKRAAEVSAARRPFASHVQGGRRAISRRAARGEERQASPAMGVDARPRLSHHRRPCRWPRSTRRSCSRCCCRYGSGRPRLGRGCAAGASASSPGRRPIKLYAGENPATWACSETPCRKKPKSKHHKAIPFVELPAFMAGLACPQ